MDKKVCFLVVIYGKDFWDSSTFLSLEKYSKYKEIEVYIHNNGPNSLINSFNSNSERFYNFKKISFFENLNNQSLSSIYNFFIDKTMLYDRRVILDDDTVLNDSFISKIFDLAYYDLELPKIFEITNNKQYFPLLSNEILLYERDISDIGGGVILSAGSGLVISKKIVDIFVQEKLSLFDQNFFLYGVDYSFFLRLYKIQKKKKYKLIIHSESTILHNMSQNQKIESWRQFELHINDILLFRHYPSFLTFVKFVKLIFVKIQKIQIFSLLNLILILVIGRHPKVNHEN